MSWTTLIGLIVLLILGARFLTAHPKVGREHFPAIVRKLLVQAKNGGYIRLDDRASDFWFSIERFDGDDESAVFVLRVPRHERVTSNIEGLRTAMQSNGFDWVDEGDDNLSLVAKVFVPIANIWDQSSGASGGHAIRLLLNEAKLPPNSKFRIERMYEPSDRYRSRDASDL
jgi:hypothetical protein